MPKPHCLKRLSAILMIHNALAPGVMFYAKSGRPETGRSRNGKISRGMETRSARRC